MSKFIVRAVDNRRFPEGREYEVQAIDPAKPRLLRILRVKAQEAQNALTAMQNAGGPVEFEFFSYAEEAVMVLPND
jgi:hypothetical protein